MIIIQNDTNYKLSIINVYYFFIIVMFLYSTEVE
jgi:hypothetical protein